MNNSIPRRCCRPVASLLGLLGVLLVLTPVDSFADSSNLGAILDPPPSDQDRETYQTLKKLFAQGSQKDGWNPMQQRSLVYLSSGDILLQSLRHNLPLRMSERDADKVKQAVQEAEAVFYPVFRVSVGKSDSFTYDRYQTGQVYQKKFQPAITGGDPYLDIPTAASTDPQIDRMGYIVQTEATVNKSYMLHKKQHPSSAHTTWSGSLSVNQQLPWGQQLSLSKVTTRTDTYYDPRRKKSWNAPWAVTVTANALLPFGKNFGIWSPMNVSLKQSKLQAKKVDWTLKSTVNSILAQTTLAYWDLVQKVENLKVALQNQEDLEVQVARAERMLAAGRITRYGHAQIATELAHAKVAVMQGKEAMISTSTNLSAIIEDDQKAVAGSLILPVEYFSRLDTRHEVDWKKAVATALNRRPELKAKKLDTQASKLEQNLRINQARPDILVSISKTLKQDSSTYGKTSIGESWSDTFKPDSNAFNAGVTYTYPWQNRAAKAALSRSGMAMEDSRLSEQRQRQLINREVNDALTTLSSANARIDSATSYEKLADIALKKGLKRWQVKADIRETELVKKSRDLLNARLSRIAATIAYKQAETRLLFAQGIIAEQVAAQSALNDFDRHRLLVLSSSGATPYFSQPAKKDDSVDAVE
jgi:outer membrane protein TolC